MRSNVPVGAWFLDAVNPDWFKSVTEDIDTFNGVNGVLSQVYGTTRDGWDALKLTRFSAVVNGFLLDPHEASEADYARLDEAWTAEVRDRIDRWHSEFNPKAVRGDR